MRRYNSTANGDCVGAILRKYEETSMRCDKRRQGGAGLLTAANLAIFSAFATLNLGMGLLRAGDEKPLPPLKGHKRAITLLAFSQDGKQLLSASKDNKILLWSTETGKKLAEVPNSGLTSLRAAAWAPDGKALAVQDDKGALYIWDISHLDNIKTLKKMPARGYCDDCLTFSPDGKWLVTGGHGILDMTTMQPPKEATDERGIGVPKDVNAFLEGKRATRYYLRANVVFSPDSKWYVTTYEGVIVQLPNAFPEQRDPNPSQVSPSYVVLNRSLSPPTAYFARWTKGNKSDKAPVRALGFALGEKKTLAVVLRENGQLERYRIQRAGTVEQEGTDEPTLRDPDAELLAARVTMDGKSILTVQRKKGEIQAVRWDLEGEKVSSTKFVEPSVQSPLIAIAPDGSAYALTGEENTIEVYRGFLEAKK
jgi:dipeptidyl aminopeptidase/acylaminoacyl peptidase